MMRRVICAAVVIAASAIAAPAVSAQSLADVARQEEARRKNPAAKKAVKSFSNADLAASEIAPPRAAAAAAAAATEDCFKSAKDGKCAEPEKIVANSATGGAADPQQQTSEATIRRQAEQIRQRLLKAQKDFEGINATANDPARSAGERAAAARMAAQRETLMGSIENQWRALERQVADEQLPREWLDPIPLLQTRSQQ